MVSGFWCSNLLFFAGMNIFAHNMDKGYTSGAHFDKQDFTANVLPLAEYEQCTFTGCNFAAVNLTDFVFVDCTFNECNLSSAVLNNAAFRKVFFSHCKMLGLHFDRSNPFLPEFGFEYCTLNFSTFYSMKLKHTRFTQCTLHECDFTATDLTQAVLEECDLAGAVFDRSTLVKADLSTAFNYSIDPELNSIKGAKFSLHGLPGLLGKYGIDIS